MKNLTLFIIGILLMTMACRPPIEENPPVEIDYDNPILQKIIDFEDQRLADSLLHYINHPITTYRYTVAKAFTSFSDSNSIPALGGLLLDKNEKVRQMAAYALGQQGIELAGQVLIDTMAKDVNVGRLSFEQRKIMLEAVGKTGHKRYLKLLSNVSTYKAADTLLLEGQVLGIYRYMLRDIIHEDGTERILTLLKDKNTPSSVRVIAAHYLARAKKLNLTRYASDLIDILERETDVNAKMALALALGKVEKENVVRFLLKELNSKNDYRVKTNIIRALGSADYAMVKDSLLPFLSDSNTHVAVSVANYLGKKGEDKDMYLYQNLIAKETRWQVRTATLKSILKKTSLVRTQTRSRVSQVLLQQYNRAGDNTYEKAAILEAMGYHGWNFPFIKSQFIDTTQHLAIRGAALQALANIYEFPEFDRVFQLSRRRVRKEITKVLVDAAKTKDVAFLGIAAATMRKPKVKFESHVDSTTFLNKILNQLELPKDIETYNEVQKTINYFDNKPLETNLKTPDYNHPIDWKVVNKASNKTKATITTNKGEIVLDFELEAAPASVASFITLAKKGFYNGKVFHRVVPNFVIQGGCPRGDGWGSLDYSIRSELSLKYDNEGWVGMASAGKDTEGIQWFITHSPTPHLDGNYTIFAKVLEGMEVVHSIQVGDKIQDIDID